MRRRDFMKGALAGAAALVFGARQREEDGPHVGDRYVLGDDIPEAQYGNIVEWDAQREAWIEVEYIPTKWHHVTVDGRRVKVIDEARFVSSWLNAKE